MAVELSRRIDWPMIDPANVVYYPLYWDLAHRFFEEAWEPICGIDYTTIMAGLLHDVIEDTSTTTDDLEKDSDLNAIY